jgi:hypothetical protein
VCSKKRAVRGEGQGCVVVFLRRFLVFRDAAADEVGFGFRGNGRERMEGRRLLFCWWGGKKSFGVFGEVLAAVGTVETFGEDDDVGP